MISDKHPLIGSILHEENSYLQQIFYPEDVNNNENKKIYISAEELMEIEKKMNPPKKKSNPFDELRIYILNFLYIKDAKIYPS